MIRRIEVVDESAKQPLFVNVIPLCSPADRYISDHQQQYAQAVEGNWQSYVINKAEM